MNEAMNVNHLQATGPALSASKHLLPSLPYDYASLEPCIDARTVRLHHNKHHASYVEKLNAALEPFADLRQKTALWLLLNVARLPEEIRVSVRNNAGGHVNHSLFWLSMSPAGGGAPSGPLADAIDRDFGGFDKFKAQFEKTGEKLFGSGWVWLVREQREGGKLEIVTSSGHDSPLMQGLWPVLLNDVWEHAYYLKYENRRAAYLAGWWAVADWKEAARRYESSDQSAEQRWEADGGHLQAAP